jgi:hypothetical protein
VAAGFLVAALLRPRVLRPLNQVWFRFGLLLHRLVSPVAIGIIFWLVITPMALVIRLIGRDVLRRKLDPEAETYMLDRQPLGVSQMRNQF